MLTVFLYFISVQSLAPVVRVSPAWLYFLYQPQGDHDEIPQLPQERRDSLHSFREGSRSREHPLPLAAPTINTYDDNNFKYKKSRSKLVEIAASICGNRKKISCIKLFGEKGHKDYTVNF